MVGFKGHTSVNDLAQYIRLKRPSLYHTATTSTVIPFTKAILNYLDGYDDLTLVDLTGLPTKMELEGEELVLEGPISWQEARGFLQSKGRDLACYPTELSAGVLAGIATSATGARSFSFGGIRDQVIEVDYLDYQADLKTLKTNNSFTLKNNEYDAAVRNYDGFKNPPFPRLDRETDLMTGMEGQLGVLTKCRLKTIPWKNLTYLFIKVPHWKDEDSAHLEVHHEIQRFKDKVYACEFMDCHLLKIEGEEVDHDLIALELPAENLETIYNDFIVKLNSVAKDDCFEVSPDEYRKRRQKKPATMAEYLRQQGIVKMGTDAQVKSEHLKDLFQVYREWTDLPHTLFGHLGDAHLHFNFFPRENQRKQCEMRFLELYQKVVKWQGSPFAEHGIGMLKKEYLKLFLQEPQYRMFKLLKEKHDPENIFFPMGFLNLKPDPSY